MFEIVLNKLNQNPQLAVMLMATGDEELVEGNTWGDRTWGVCDGVGQNRPGKILVNYPRLKRRWLAAAR